MIMFEVLLNLGTELSALRTLKESLKIEKTFSGREEIVFKVSRIAIASSVNIDARFLDLNFNTSLVKDKAEKPPKN